MGNEKRQFLSSQYLIIVLVIGLGVFMMVLPQNLLSTISSPGFVTYMGIGDGEIRLDIRQTENIAGKTKQLEKLLAGDERAERFAILRTISCRAVLPDGSYTSLPVEQGSHTTFPVTYAEGASPKANNEIALSFLCADELGLSVGDKVLLAIDENVQKYTVCGIYSDITNGGKTAKAAYLHDDGPLMWSVFYVSLKNDAVREQWLSKYARILCESGISAKMVDVQEYVADTYGQTIQEIRMAAQVAGAALKTLGATGFHFLIDYKIVCGWIPGIAVITVFCAILLGLSEIKNIRAYECCMGKG